MLDESHQLIGSERVEFDTLIKEDFGLILGCAVPAQVGAARCLVALVVCVLVTVFKSESLHVNEPQAEIDDRDLVLELVAPVAVGERAEDGEAALVEIMKNK